MHHSPLQLIESSLFFENRICFTGFNAQILSGSRIALMGRNGSGKSSLLKVLSGQMSLSEGRLKMPENLLTGYVPQYQSLNTLASGGESLSRALHQALRQNPDLLLLDEPTNHLDEENRAILFRKLKQYSGTLIFASHDLEMVSEFAQTLWIFESGGIEIFNGTYEAYQAQKHLRRHEILKELRHLSQKEDALHQSLMQEQKRAAGSRKTGEKNKAKKKVLKVQANTQRSYAEETSGQKKALLREQKQELKERLGQIRMPEMIKPYFSFSAEKTSDRILFSVRGGCAGYEGNWVIQNLDFSLSGKSRIALTGKNGSGKTTLIRGILGHEEVQTSGTWLLPNLHETGYLDQRYANLNPDLTVAQTLQKAAPQLSDAEIRHFLLAYLFKTNPEVNQRVSLLSEGEKARLSLALMGIKTPRLLILDELSNNLDDETREHVIQVVSQYPGALLAISHDPVFLKRLNIEEFYQLNQGFLKKMETGF